VVARGACVSAHTTWTWLVRYRVEGDAGLQDRPRRPHRLAGRRPRHPHDESVRARERRWASLRIAQHGRLPLSTFGVDGPRSRAGIGNPAPCRRRLTRESTRLSHCHPPSRHMRRAAVAFLAAALLDGCSASRRGTPLQSPPAAAADTLPALPAADRVRVAEAFRLAAAVGGVATIVVGQPAHTGQTSTRWVLTALHEHFHQLQFSQPGYYPGVTALGLARGDTTGMWMLNHGFPTTLWPCRRGSPPSSAASR
jgi:hypothetical protein